MDTVTNRNGCCDQLEWTLWPMRNIAMTNQNRCHDKSEWIRWLIKMDMMANQNGLCGQSEEKLWAISTDPSHNSCCSWLPALTGGNVIVSSWSMLAVLRFTFPQQGMAWKFKSCDGTRGMQMVFRRMVALTSLLALRLWPNFSTFLPFLPP